jgi:hypothetical protein
LRASGGEGAGESAPSCELGEGGGAEDRRRLGLGVRLLEESATNIIFIACLFHSITTPIYNGNLIIGLSP